MKFGGYKLRCPGCGHNLDAAVNMSKTNPPTEGDAGICIHCGTIVVLTNGALEFINQKKWDSLKEEEQKNLMNGRMKVLDELRKAEVESSRLVGRA